MSGRATDPPDASYQHAKPHGIDRRGVVKVDNDSRPAWHGGKGVPNTLCSRLVEVAGEITTHSEDGDVGDGHRDGHRGGFERRFVRRQVAIR
jgi:hypothetical protein